MSAIREERRVRDRRRAAVTKPAEQIAGTPPRTVMTSAYVETVGRLAYIWGWPLVNGHNRAAAFEQLPEPGHIGGILPAAVPELPGSGTQIQLGVPVTGVDLQRNRNAR